jgi:hypothetical protein
LIWIYRSPQRKPPSANISEDIKEVIMRPIWKNGLKGGKDIKEVIMRLIWSRFSLQRPKIEIDETVEACQRAFGTVCSFIWTRDLIQEHIAFRVWPLVDS